MIIDEMGCSWIKTDCERSDYEYMKWGTVSDRMQIRAYDREDCSNHNIRIMRVQMGDHGEMPRQRKARNEANAIRVHPHPV